MDQLTSDYVEFVRMHGSDPLDYFRECYVEGVMDLEEFEAAVWDYLMMDREV